MSQANALEQLMLELINEERASVGLDPLRFNGDLNEASEDHSDWMLDEDIFSHTGQNGSSAGDRIQQAGYELEGNWTWGENIAWQSERGAPGLADDVRNLHESLMNSPGHRANILNPNYEEIGIGIERGDFQNYDSVMVTQNFGTTDATPDPSPITPPAPEPDPVSPPALEPDPVTPPAPDPDPVPDPQPAPIGTNDRDTLVGGSGDDGLFGQGEDDSLNGAAGNDTLGAGPGDDTVSGGAGNDNIGGGTGDDRLSGGTGDDIMGGGSGADTVTGDQGNDIVNGGAGNDDISGREGNDTMGGGFGNDMVTGGDGADNLGGGTGQDTINGGEGNDMIGGGEGDDIISGGAGNDFLAGGGRNDRIDGGTGADRINAGTGDDTVTGGDGADIFVFNAFTSGEADTITDFQDGTDVIRLLNIPGAGSANKLSALDITDTADGARITYDGHSITLQGTDAADLTTEDFLFV